MSELVREQRPPWRLWMVAAVGAVSLHVAGAALALAHLHPGDDEGLAFNTTVIGIDLESPTAEDTELPPGPDSDASAASPERAEQKAEVAAYLAAQREAMARARPVTDAEIERYGASEVHQDLQYIRDGIRELSARMDAEDARREQARQEALAEPSPWQVQAQARAEAQASAEASWQPGEDEHQAQAEADFEAEI